ncbi:MAG: hypothetical protein HY901_20550, partial [Deltaproteobacteria bacterium]|nr:hypothetical protein [Deltaproteobacteria bacterium]
LSGAEDNASYVLSIRSERGLEISTVSLPDAIVGKAYLANLATRVADPTSPIVWSTTCTPRYNDQNELLPCRQALPPGIVLSPEGALASVEVSNCALPVDAPVGCPEGLACASDGHCVIKAPDADESGHIPERTVYSFLVRAVETKTQRTAVRALSITVRVDQALPSIPLSEGCSAGAGEAGLLSMVLGLLPWLHRRGGARRASRRRGLALVGLLGGLALLVGLPACDDQPDLQKQVSRCDNVTCDSGLECDPGDGMCKCGGEGGTFCQSGGVCTSGVCVYACEGMVCDRGMSLDVLDCTCKCGLTPCESGQACDAATRTCYLDTRCQGVSCAGGMSCDPADGSCKCGAAACPEGEVCKAGACTADPCAGVSCTGGALCDGADGVCKCGGTAGRACSWGELCSCPAGSSCQDTERRCAVSARCVGVVCSSGATCDPADGQCRCGGPGGPVCQFGQSCDVLRRVCLGGDRCAAVVCKEGLSCDPEDGRCKCGGINGVNGEVCETGDICAHFMAATRCVMSCDPRTQGCATGEACYYDMHARVSFCGTQGPNAQEGSGCRTLADCGKGLHCVQLPNQTGNCRRYCNVPDGANGCPQAGGVQECIQLEGAEENVGACNLSR